MPTFFKQEKSCIICSGRSWQTHVRSLRTCGGLDLDLRPPEDFRSMLNYSIECCPYCKYVADDIAAYTPLSATFLSGETYLTCCPSELSGEWPIKFFRKALIALETYDEVAAFYALLHAAWACDDNNDDHAARKCRRWALRLSNMLINDTLYYSDPLAIIRIDLLRRIKQFDVLLEECQDMLFQSPVLNRIVQFHMEKARQRDSLCYTINDALAFRRID